MASTVDLVVDLDQKDPEPASFKSMSFKERFDYVKEVITVEPMLVAYVMASVICVPALNQLKLEKACRVDLAFNDSICDNVLDDEKNKNVLNETKQELIDVVTTMNSWQGSLENVMPLILILFLGSYSDRHQLRKPFIIIPILGEFLAVAGCILCVVFMKQWPLAVQGVVQTIVPSFFGGPPMIYMGVFSYIADVSTVQMRTIRIGVVQIVLNIFTPIGQAMAGHLFGTIGYYGVFSIAVACYLFALLYTVFRIKEPKRPKFQSDKSFLADIFDPRYIIETINLLLKKSKENNRVMIGVIMCILFIYSLVSAGESNVIYLFGYLVFKWGPEEFSYFLTSDTVIHLIGTSIGLSLFARYLELEDLSILVITLMTKLLGNIVFGVGKSEFMFYVALVVTIFTGLANIAIRSIATKVVSIDNLGKAQSIFGICSGVAQAVAPPLYNEIFIKTTASYPTIFFYFGALLSAFCTGIAIWLYCKMGNKEEKKEEQEKQENDVKAPDGTELTQI